MLTDSQVKAAKPSTEIKIRTQGKRAGEPYTPNVKLYDADGLYLLISPSGTKSWRFRYQKPTGGESGMALGQYPMVSLRKARKRRDALRVGLADGIDPVEQKNAQKREAEATLREVVRDFYRQPGLPKTAYINERRIERLLFRQFGDRHVDDIRAGELLDAFAKVVNDKGLHETVARTRMALAAVYRHAILRGLTTANPADALKGAPALRGGKSRPIAAVTRPEAIGPLMRAVWAYDGPPSLKLALRFLPYVFVRPGELRLAVWDEIDGDTWRIPAERMKMDRPHVVPLSRQALAILDEARQLHSPAGLIFPGLRTERKPLSPNALNVALRTAGVGKDQHTSHGFRSTASSELNRLKWRADVVELQLAHVERNSVRRAYMRSDLMDERRSMMESWADHLDTLRTESNVVAIGKNTCEAAGT